MTEEASTTETPAAAAILSTAGVKGRDPARPLLCRTEASLAALLRRLLDDLSSSDLWLETKGLPPPNGTPIWARYSVPSLSLMIDLGAVVGAAVGTNVLLRFDRLDETQLRAIAECHETITPDAEANKESIAEWQPPAPNTDTHPAAPEHHPEASLDSPSSGATVLLPKIDRAAPATFDPRGSTLFLAVFCTLVGLGAAWLAAQKLYGERDEILRRETSEAITKLSQQLDATRRARHRDALAGAFLERRSAWVEGFDQLLICSRRGCRTRAGTEPPPELVDRFEKLAPQEALHIEPLDETHHWLVLREAEGFAAGVVKKESSPLKEPQEAPPRSATLLAAAALGALLVSLIAALAASKKLRAKTASILEAGAKTQHDREREALRFSRAASDEEARLLYQQMSARLEHDAEPSLKTFLSLGPLAARRIDLQVVIEDAVRLARESFGGRPLFLSFEAKEAAFFPRISAKESDVREKVHAAITDVAGKIRQGTIALELTREDTLFKLAITSKDGPSIVLSFPMQLR